MSIPYALAIHDDFLRDCLVLLVAAGRCSTKQLKAARSLAAKHPLIMPAAEPIRACLP